MFAGVSAGQPIIADNAVQILPMPKPAAAALRGTGLLALADCNAGVRQTRGPCIPAGTVGFCRRTQKEHVMAKGEQKSNREAKKPKATKTAAKGAAAANTPPPRPEPGKK